MKKLPIIFFVILSFLAVGFFTSCNDTSAPIPEDPPAEEVINWIDTVPGGFFQLVSISDEGTFTRSASSATVIEDIFVVFDEDGEISLWKDYNGNGILEPEDYLGSGGQWELVDNQLYIGGVEFFLGYVQQDEWSMTLDISDEFEDCLGEAGYEVEGTRTFVYQRANPVYMTDDMLITTEFPFVFSDRNETGLAYTLEHSCSWWHTTWYLNEEEILLDDFDGFYFTWGDVDIILLTFDSSDQSLIIVDGDAYWLTDEDAEFVFAQDAVYDMTITVQPNDVAYFEFVSRLDTADIFTVPAMIDYDGLGAVTIIAVDDVGGLIL